MKLVTINGKYGFKADGGEYALYRLVTVDPTKSPGYKPDSSGTAPEPREEWRAAGRYYPVNETGLASMLVYVAQRTVSDGDYPDTLADYIRLLRAEIAALKEAVALG